VPEKDPVVKMPKQQTTHRDGAITVSASLGSHVSGPESWNRSWEDAARSPAGEELTSAETEMQPSVPPESMTRKLSKRRIVGDRSTLYAQHTTTRNPIASVKPAGTFTLNND
jgi:hypothetical protein